MVPGVGGRQQPGWGVGGPGDLVPPPVSPCLQCLNVAGVSTIGALDEGGRLIAPLLTAEASRGSTTQAWEGFRCCSDIRVQPVNSHQGVFFGQEFIHK